MIVKLHETFFNTRWIRLQIQEWNCNEIESGEEGKIFSKLSHPPKKGCIRLFFLRTHASYLGRYTQVSKKERDGASLYFLSFATYLNCFLMGLPSMSTKRKVLVAEVASPRHLVGFQRPGALHTLFRLGALILSTDFLTASKRSKRAQ